MGTAGATHRAPSQLGLKRTLQLPPQQACGVLLLERWGAARGGKYWWPIEKRGQLDPRTR